MHKVSDENESFDARDLILAQPTISENLTLKKPAIGGDSLFKLERPAISGDLTQRFIHHLKLPDFNHSNEDSR